ncbi:hypothetical protein HF325_004783 [Metschnikowia pulcherrima]|uniref:Enoyl reductase (ER) domain-containing protein n=1 Tax=Metschnikowia pulcherrima TaxID=27326 RepID=A0A8H7GR57_9ASCO|nr:hypothetical protein HF325_004783 [Metschnikowia pulcherrima]
MSSNSLAYLTAPGAPLIIKEASIPEPAADEIIVENKAVAINPIDFIIAKSGFLVQKFPVILGLDSAGVVVATGTEAAKTFTKEDRGFQKYSAVRTLTTSKIPDDVSFVEGSTFPLGIFTAAIGLFIQDNLALDFPQVPKKGENGKTILIWGGASSVGANAIQLAVAAGYRVVATASEKNFELVRKLGATEVLDYRKDSIIDDATKVLANTDLVGTFLAAANGDSFSQAADITQAVNEKAQLVSAPLYPKDFKPKVKASWTNLSIANYPEETRKLASHIFGEFLPQALERKAFSIVPAPRVLGKGLENLQEGLQIMAAGVSAEKLVVEL